MATAESNSSGSQKQKDKVEAPKIEHDVWNEKVLPQLKDILRLTFLSAWGYVEWREGSVGVYGLDVMVDTDLHMWLIEVNKSPCMAYSTDVTAHLIPRFMEDMAKVIIDETANDTGDLELILEHQLVREPQEHRSAEDYTVSGERLGSILRKKSQGKTKR